MNVGCVSHSPRAKLVDRFQVVHNVLEGPALLDVQMVTCFLVGVPVIDHDLESRSLPPLFVGLMTLAIDDDKL